MTPSVFVSFFIAGLLVVTMSPSAMDLFLKLMREHLSTKEEYLLTIGILSARDNFETRQAIRETWMRSHESEQFSDRINVKFVIGDTDCNIHLDNRLSQYDCNRWETSFSKDCDQPISAIRLKTFMKDRQPTIYSSVRFTVMHSVVIRRLGVVSKLKLQGDPLKVRFIDSFRDETVADVSFSDFDCGTVVDGYRFQPIKPILLHQGFEGIIQVSGNQKLLVNTSFYQHEVSVINGCGGVILIKGYQKLNSSQNFDQHVSSLFLPSFFFSVQDNKLFKEHVLQQNIKDDEWKQKLKLTDKRLIEEAKLFGDILFVNITDVYRSLPNKLLHFHHLIQRNFPSKFIMKTDDDCFVDINRIYLYIRSMNYTKKLWVGQFREDWFIEQYGKWAESEYKALSYPIFACGSGNIVSQPVNHWIADNNLQLKPYQGEDVSMGIWLSAIGVHIVADERWVCTSTCIPDAFVLPELSPGQIRQAWLNKQKCGSPCSCDTE